MPKTTRNIWLYPADVLKIFTVARKDGHHPIIFMQCGPVRHNVDAKAEACARPFEHTVIVRPTGFRPLSEFYEQLLMAVAAHRV